MSEKRRHCKLCLQREDAHGPSMLGNHPFAPIVEAQEARLEEIEAHMTRETLAAWDREGITAEERSRRIRAFEEALRTAPTDHETGERHSFKWWPPFMSDRHPDVDSRCKLCGQPPDAEVHRVADEKRDE